MSGEAAKASRKVARKNITYSQNDQLPDGLIAQLVEHCIGIDGFTLEGELWVIRARFQLKQGSKMYVFLHISVLISNLVTKHIQYAE